MTHATHTVERAYQLARSGDFTTVKEIRTRLTTEGFVAVRGHLDGPAIQRALLALCVTAKLSATSAAQCLPAPLASEAGSSAR
jgi:hypothetical protein